MDNSSYRTDTLLCRHTEKDGQKARSGHSACDRRVEDVARPLQGHAHILESGGSFGTIIAATIPAALTTR